MSGRLNQAIVIMFSVLSSGGRTRLRGWRLGKTWREWEKDLSTVKRIKTDYSDMHIVSDSLFSESFLQAEPGIPPFIPANYQVPNESHLKWPLNCSFWKILVISCMRKAQSAEASRFVEHLQLYQFDQVQSTFWWFPLIN